MCLDTLYRFIFNSDYPTDKVVYLKEGQVTLNGSGYASVSIDNPLDKAPYIKGCISLNNWQSSLMFGTTRTASAGNVTDLIIATLRSFNNVLTLELNMSKHANATVKYRLWGVISEDNTGIEATKNSSITKSKLIFNSENNYPRLIKDGIAKSGETVEHNLKRIPFIDYWYDWNSTSRLKNVTYNFQPSGEFTTGASTTTPTVLADEDKLYFKKLNNDDVYYYYRIYA